MKAVLVLAVLAFIAISAASGASLGKSTAIRSLLKRYMNDKRKGPSGVEGPPGPAGTKEEKHLPLAVVDFLHANCDGASDVLEDVCTSGWVIHQLILFQEFTKCVVKENADLSAADGVRSVVNTCGGKVFPSSEEDDDGTDTEKDTGNELKKKAVGGNNEERLARLLRSLLEK